MARLLSTIIKGFIASAETFIPGFMGEGWKLWNHYSEKREGKPDVNRYKLEIDDLTVRSSMTVYELLIQKIRALKGALGITQACGKVESVEEDSLRYYLTIEDEMCFMANDFIRCQRFDQSKNVLHGYWVKVESITELVEYDDGTVSKPQIIILKSEFGNHPEIGAQVVPAVGDDIVQFGNSVNTSRQSAVYLTTEDASPRIQILNGISGKSFSGCNRVILGRLDGITDKDFTGTIAPKGYGLWADNVFLKGNFVLSGGKTIEDYTQGELDEREKTIVEYTGGKIREELTAMNRNLFARGTCQREHPLNEGVDINDCRPMAVNTPLYKNTRLKDGFAQINNTGPYYWYLESDFTSSTGLGEIVSCWGGNMSDYPTYGENAMVATYNDYYTVSFDYYIAGNIPGTTFQSSFYIRDQAGTISMNEMVTSAPLSKTPNQWNRQSLTIDLTKYKSIFREDLQKYFQFRIVDGTGVFNMVNWKIYFRNLKLEKGKVATEFIPALDETGDMLQMLNTTVTKQAGLIESKVSKDDIGTVISQETDNIRLAVLGANDVVSAINVVPGTVKINANKISLNGIVTANNNVQITTDGKIKAKDAEIEGKITATEGTLKNVTITGGETSERLIISSADGSIKTYDSRDEDVLTIKGGQLSFFHLDGGSVLSSRWIYFQGLESSLTMDSRSILVGKNTQQRHFRVSTEKYDELQLTLKGLPTYNENMEEGTVYREGSYLRIVPPRSSGR